MTEADALPGQVHSKVCQGMRSAVRGNVWCAERKFV